MILVPLFDLKFLYQLAATAVGTSNRRHLSNLLRIWTQCEVIWPHALEDVEHGNHLDLT
jgi:hypothetical protein